MTTRAQLISFVNERINMCPELFDPSPIGFVENGEELKLSRANLVELPALVKDVLTLSTTTYSVYLPEYKHGFYKVACDPNRRRSAWDIWLHVKRYKPETKLTDVMATLYELRDNLRVQICSQIHRRVFYPAWMHRAGPLMLHESGTDEYNLTFPDWGRLKSRRKSSEAI
jgi:hypothetical protein